MTLPIGKPPTSIIIQQLYGINKCKGKGDTRVKTKAEEGVLFTTTEIHSSEDLGALEEQPQGTGDG